MAFGSDEETHKRLDIVIEQNKQLLILLQRIIEELQNLNRTVRNSNNTTPRSY